MTASFLQISSTTHRSSRGIVPTIPSRVIAANTSSSEASVDLRSMKKECCSVVLGMRALGTFLGFLSRHLASIEKMDFSVTPATALAYVLVFLCVFLAVEAISALVLTLQL